MKIRFPFKGLGLRWRDDASRKEKFIWGIIFASIGMTLGSIIDSLF